FAPSPTGMLHIGNIRTALFNWLLAHKAQGGFLLCIEDTDVSRAQEAAVSALMEDLRWLGLECNEGSEVEGGVEAAQKGAKKGQTRFVRVYCASGEGPDGQVQIEFK